MRVPAFQFYLLCSLFELLIEHIHILSHYHHNMKYRILALFAICIPALTVCDASELSDATFESTRFCVRTVDGVVIKGASYSAANDKVIIYGHRLLGGDGAREIGLLIDTFIDTYDLITFEFRGHEGSFGESTTGGVEILDLRAVIAYARSMGYGTIAFIGAGMGGTVGVRTALIFRNIDALVVISPSGFKPRISPFVVRLLSHIALDTSFGKVPLRIVTNARLGRRYSTGYPIDLLTGRAPVPTLIIHSEKDRLVSLDELLAAFEGLFEPEELRIIPGRRHAEDLIAIDNLCEIKSFLFQKIGASQEARGFPEPSNRAPHTDDIRLTGDLPMPERVFVDEVRGRINARGGIGRKAPLSPQQVAVVAKDVLAFHGYTRASISILDSIPALSLHVVVPKVRSVAVEDNYWLDEDYIRSILKIGGDHFNKYELDAALRRLSSHPAVQTAIPRVSVRDDGNVDIHAQIVEQRPYRFILATKFTDYDKFFGVGVTWNEFNPTGFQYEGMGMLGIRKYGLLTSHSIQKNLLGSNLRLSLAYKNIVKSRDDLDYIFTRQEVRERGGEFSARYRISSSVAARLELFGKKYLSPEISPDHPVEAGFSGGGALKVDLSGRLPFQGPPRLHWLHTFYYEKAGPGEIGDFTFDAFQFNMITWQPWFEHSMTRTTFHGGWVSGEAPPQDYLSLGGMHTFPGYPDDEFVDTRMILASQSVFVSMQHFVEEASAWAPLRWIVSFHAGTVWGTEEKFRMKDVRTDVVFEFDYMETLRAGVAVPTGGLSTGSPRVYIGWGEHVF
jgi:pimeloyl-ACP methyl ester carboxylesterase